MQTHVHAHAHTHTSSPQLSLHPLAHGWVRQEPGSCSSCAHVAWSGAWEHSVASARPEPDNSQLPAPFFLHPQPCQQAETYLSFDFYQTLGCLVCERAQGQSCAQAASPGRSLARSSVPPALEHTLGAGKGSGCLATGARAAAAAGYGMGKGEE